MEVKLKKYLGREIIEQATFQVKGTFQSMYAAHEWLLDRGYDWGSSSAMKPTGVIKGDYVASGLPQKWKNFSKTQEKEVHGAITGDMREGPVTVYLFK